MWHLLEKISEQVTKYSTFLGQLWYLLVFLFRLIVVVTIGGAVYGDEQSAFKCSTDVIGCSNMCYNQFAKVSHMRFWAFQLLAVATPTVFFHFYSIYVSGEIQKLKTSEERLKALEDGEGDNSIAGNPEAERDFRKMSRRKKSIGNVKVKKIYSGNEMKEVPLTNKIHYAYFVSVILRLVMEGVFIYLGYQLFKLMDPTCVHHPQDPLCPGSSNPLYFLTIRVPAMYICQGDPGTEVYDACTMHVRDGGFVPCWVSRPYEKTVFLCYMTILSGICFLLCCCELVVIAIRRFVKGQKSNRRRNLFRSANTHQRNESVFYHTAPSAPSNKYYDEPRHGNGFYPSLAVPVRIQNRYPNSNSAAEKHVQIERRDEEMDRKENMSETASVKSF